MRGKTGIIMMVLGAALLCGALLLFLSNEKESSTAQAAAVSVMPRLVQQIQQNREQEAEPDLTEDLLVPVELLTDEDVQMTETTIDGNGYIGYLSMPDLGLELPVIGSWSYRKLNIAPCRYTGSLRGEDLVIMAHNYRSHFGKLSQLRIGDELAFTDMDGKVTHFAVMAKNVLPPTAVEEITSGEYDLTLFTCTYGGASRVTVFCDKVTE